MDNSFRIPGPDGPEIVVRRPNFGAISVLVDGVKADRISRRKLIFRVPLRDGTTTDVELSGQLRGLRAVVSGQTIPLERQLATWEVLLQYLPFVLIGIGGLVGGVFAGVGAVINHRLVRAIGNVPLRIVAVLGVTALAAALWFGTAVLISPLPKMALGTA